MHSPKTVLLLALFLPGCSLFYTPDVGPARVAAMDAQAKSLEMEQVHNNLADAFARSVAASTMSEQHKTAYLSNIAQSKAALLSRSSQLHVLLGMVDGYLEELGTSNQAQMQAATAALLGLHDEVRIILDPTFVAPSAPKTSPWGDG